MKVCEMIERMKLLPQTAIVKIWNGNSENFEPVSGFDYDNKEIILCSDE